MVDCPLGNTAIIFVKGCRGIYGQKCNYCYNLDLLTNSYENDQDLTFKQLCKKIDQLSVINTKTNKKFNTVEYVTISGGEALDMNFSLLLMIIWKIQKMGLKTALYTNGSHPKKLKFLLKNHLIDFVNCDFKFRLENMDISESLWAIKKYASVFRINSTIDRQRIPYIPYMAKNILNIFGQDFPVKWYNDNNTNCWQLTPVKSDVPTLGKTEELFEEDKEEIREMFSKVFFKKLQ